MLLIIIILLLFIMVSGGGQPIVYELPYKREYWMPDDLLIKYKNWVPDKATSTLMSKFSGETNAFLAYRSLPNIWKIYDYTTLIHLQKIFNRRMPPIRTSFKVNCQRYNGILPMGLEIGDVKHNINDQIIKLFSSGHFITKTAKGIKQIVLDPSTIVQIDEHRTQYEQTFSQHLKILQKDFNPLYEFCYSFYQFIMKKSPYVKDITVAFSRHDFGCGLRSHFDDLYNNDSDIYVINLFEDYYYDIFPILASEIKGLRILIKKDTYVRLSQSARYEWTHGIPDLIPTREHRYAIIFKCRNNIKLREKSKNLQALMLKYPILDKAYNDGIFECSSLFAFSKAKIHDYPFKKYSTSINDLINIFNELRKEDATLNFNNHNKYFILTEYFTEKAQLKNAYDVFMQNRHEMAKSMIKKKIVFTVESIKNEFYSLYPERETNMYNPAWARGLIQYFEKFIKINSVFDTSAEYGGRLIGTLSLGKKYTGLASVAGVDYETIYNFYNYISGGDSHIYSNFENGLFDLIFTSGPLHESFFNYLNTGGVLVFNDDNENTVNDSKPMNAIFKGKFTFIYEKNETYRSFVYWWQKQ